MAQDPSDFWTRMLRRWQGLAPEAAPDTLLREEPRRPQPWPERRPPAPATLDRVH